VNMLVTFYTTLFLNCKKGIACALAPGQNNIRWFMRFSRLQGRSKRVFKFSYKILASSCLRRAIGTTDYLKEMSDPYLVVEMEKQSARRSDTDPKASILLTECVEKSAGYLVISDFGHTI
ncbi:hypothetical protein LOAG_02630, partial [Loa loa]